MYIGRGEDVVKEELLDEEREQDDEQPFVVRGPHLIYGGFKYVKERIRGLRIYWRCVKCTHRSIRCSARMHTIQSRIVKFISNHNHGPTSIDLTSTVLDNGDGRHSVELLWP